MAIVLSAKSKVLTGGAVGVAFLLSGFMFCNMFGVFGPEVDGGSTAVVGGVANRVDEKYKKNWYPTSLHLYQKVTYFIHTIQLFILY